MPDFAYEDLLPLGDDETPYRLISTEGVSTFEAAGRTFLQVEPEALRLLTETEIERVLSIAAQEKPTVLVIDSIQTVYTSTLQSAPGSVAQVRECAAPPETGTPPS